MKGGISPQTAGQPMTNAQRCAEMALIAQYAPWLTDDEKFKHVMACKQKDAEAWERIQARPQQDLFQRG